LNSSTNEPDTQLISFGTGGVFIAPVFLLLAAWFLFGAERTEKPSATTPKFNKATLGTGPARRYVATDPPVVHIHEFDRTCNECHKTFYNPDPRVTKLEQHRHIKLQHGINTHCYDCHHRLDRNSLRLKDGDKLSFAKLVSLCAQCHTAIYRDWQSGLHGKRLGHWDPTKGERKALLCVGCHDPHWPSRPAMSGVRPLPGPNTLRMGKPSDDHSTESPDPLQRAVHKTNGTHR
jgi:Cytochrome c554 and c-prime